jgi:hypothetical protein
MASLLRVDVVPRREVARRRLDAPPQPHVLRGYGNQAVGRMLAAQRRTLQRVIDSTTCDALDDFQTLLAKDELDEIGTQIQGLYALVATYLATQGTDPAEERNLLTTISADAERVEGIALTMREDRADKTATSPLAVVRRFAEQLKRDAVRAIAALGAPPNTKGPRYTNETEPTTVNALTGGTMKHLLITPRPGTGEAEGGGQQYPENVTKDREMVLALPPRASQPAPFKGINMNGTKPPVLDVLAVGGGHGGVKALFDQEQFGNFSAKYWKDEVVDPLIGCGVTAKLIVLDACLTASMFDVFAPLLAPKGRIIGSMYSINGRILTPEVWQEIFDAEAKGEDVTPIVERSGRALAQKSALEAANTMASSMRSMPPHELVDLLTREPGLTPIVSKLRYLSKIADMVGGYLRAKNDARKRECVQELRDIENATPTPHNDESVLAVMVADLLEPDDALLRDNAVGLVRNTLQGVTNSKATDFAELRRALFEQTKSTLATSPYAAVPAQSAVFDLESKSIRFDQTFHDKTARRNVELSTAVQSRGEMAGIDRELNKMASSGLAQLVPVPREQIFDH